MKKTSNNRANGNFALTDHVLLLFNEHDTRIALNWETFEPKYSAPSGDQVRSRRIAMVV